MRSKEELLKELSRDDEKARERERPSMETLQLEVLIDIRDALVSTINKKEQPSKKEEVKDNER